MLPCTQRASHLSPKLVDLGPESLRHWVLQARVGTGVTDGPMTTELDELKALRAVNRDLEEANEFLKAALIFFARQLDRRPSANLSVRSRTTGRRSSGSSRCAPSCESRAYKSPHVVFDWVYWYNNDRLYSSLDHQTPEEFERAYFDEMTGLLPGAAVHKTAA